MSRWHLASLVALCCGCGAGGAADAGSDAVIVDPFYMTRTYVISRIDVGPASMDGLSTYGVDLDGVVSNNDGPCTGRPDTLSAFTGLPGNDNQFAPVFPVLDMSAGPEGENGALRDRILGGELLILIEVSGVVSFVNQSSVDVDVMLAHVRAGDTLAADATGMALAPGQHFERMTDLGTVQGSIVAGRLVADTHASIALFPIGSPVAYLPVRELRLRARITSTSLQGELGGETREVELLMWLSATTFDVQPGAIEELFMPDLDPDATGAHCRGVSIGAAFDAVEALRTP